MSLRFARAVLELARGRYPQALAALEGAEELAGQMVRPHLMVASIRTRMVQALVRAPRPAALPGGEAGRAGRRAIQAPLTDSETRILLSLPTHLTAQEIASELTVSVHPVPTHMRPLYAKLGVHRRTEAVERARALGLLAPASHGS